MKRMAANRSVVESIRRSLDGHPQLHGRPDGFVRLEMIRPMDATDQIWLMTYWRDRDSYLAWSGVESPPPHRPLPASDGVQYFEHLAS